MKNDNSNNEKITFETKVVGKKYDYIAPDGSKCYLLTKVRGGDLAYYTFPPRRTSFAVRHKTVEEIWYFIQGHGEIWRKQHKKEKTVKVKPGTSITIPTGTHFQFRNTGEEELCFIITGMPRWPGKEEAVPVSGKWKV